MKCLQAILSRSVILIFVLKYSCLNGQFLFKLNNLQYRMDNILVNAIEQYKGDYYFVDGSTNPFYSNNRNGLFRFNEDNTFIKYNYNNGNLPTNQVFSVLSFNDSLLIATDQGIFFLKNDSFVIWNNYSDTVYRITSWKNKLLLATPKGPVLYNNGRFINVNNLFKCPRNTVFHADMNDKMILVCYKDSLLQLNLFNYQIKKYKVRQRLPSDAWSAYAVDDFIVVRGLLKNLQYGSSIHIIKNDSLQNIISLEQTTFCSPDVKISTLEYLFPSYFSKKDVGFIMYANNYFGNILWDWSMKKQQTQLVYNPYMAEMLHINDKKVLLKYKDTIWAMTRKDFDSTMGFEQIRVAKLNRNQVQVGVGSSNVNTFWDMCTFKVKSENCKCMSMGRALWIGGRTESGALKLAATTYGIGGNDFFPGPLKKNGETNEFLMNKYDKVWSVSKELIDAHIATVNNTGQNKNVADPIKNWPVYEVDGSDTMRMAPYEDINKNGYYDPEYGDYPKIKGHESFFWVMNDKGWHGESNGEPLKVQVNGMAYNYDCKTTMADSLDYFLQHAAFIEYQILYKGTEKLKDVYVGQFVDVDLGYYKDDALGSAPIYQTAFIGNADANDSGDAGTGINPGAMAVTILKGPVAQINDGRDNDNDGLKDEMNEECLMSGMGTYSNNSDPISGDPNNALEYYNVLKSLFKNGDSRYKKTSTGFNPVRHFFSHGMDPDYPDLNWTKQDRDSFFGSLDQLMLLTAGAFELNPSDEVPFHTVHYYVRNSKDSNQLPTIINGSKKLTSVYNGSYIPDCWMLKMEEFSNKTRSHLKLQPNPASESVLVISRSNGGSVSVQDIQGREIWSSLITGSSVNVDVSKFPPGVYIVEWRNSHSRAFSKLIVE